jgi:N6-adenosine-specific RNA methylase IME4
MEEKTELTEAIRLVCAETVAAKEIEVPSEKFRVFYADPPWSYRNAQPDSHTEQRDHYPVMSMDDRCTMPAKKIVADDAVLLLCATNPIHEHSFRPINASGVRTRPHRLSCRAQS